MYKKWRSWFICEGSNLVVKGLGVKIAGSIALESGQLQNLLKNQTLQRTGKDKGKRLKAKAPDLLHGLVRVRLNRRHVRVVQRVFKTNTAVIALESAQSEKCSVGNARARGCVEASRWCVRAITQQVRRRGYRDNVKAEVA